LPGWVVEDRGYCILSLGNCPPGFTQITSYQSAIDQYKFGDYVLTRHGGHANEQSFPMRINSCCR
jgi:hypothetical protein